MPAVEQTKAKRAGIGLRGLGQERTNPGFTLFVPERWRQCLPHRHRGQCRSFLTDALPNTEQRTRSLEGSPPQERQHADLRARRSVVCSR